jgi:hypothetical protein
MFEKETEQLIFATRQTTIADAKSVSLRTIFESKLPSNVKVFFRAEVEHFLDEDRKKELRSSKFNYDVPEIQMLQEQIDALLIHNFIFTRTDFETTLDKCVHFLFNFLCRPQWTLASFLFEESAAVSAQQILKKLRYCRDYVYFPDILRRYVEQRNIGEMTVEEGKALIEKIDGEVVRNHSSLELAQMIQPLFDFVAYARSHDLNAATKTIPTRALMYFFEDKKMASFHERFSREREANNVREMSFSQLANIIEKVRTGNEYAYVFGEDAEHVTAFDELSLESPTLSTGFEEGVSSFPKIFEPPKPLPPPFSLEEERSIVKYVFHQNEEQFRTAVKEALAAQSWDDAALSIDHFFLMNDVEPFTKEAILFTNRLQGRFGEQTRTS